MFLNKSSDTEYFTYLKKKNEQLKIRLGLIFKIYRKETLAFIDTLFNKFPCFIKKKNNK